MKPVVRVCFVCLGNICRSPTAEGIFRKLVNDAGLHDRVAIDSAGTGDWHVGDPPDPRTVATARARGVTIEGRAAHFTRGDFARFDYVVAMDRDNQKNLFQMAGTDADRAKIHLLRSFDPESPANASVPDPYYGEPEGFENVFDVCLAGSRGLLDHLRETMRL